MVKVLKVLLCIDFVVNHIYDAIFTLSNVLMMLLTAHRMKHIIIYFVVVNVIIADFAIF